ncbi:MAG TPA: YraN family protein [Prolixibacteraceae bacterium]|nr:YraN family protein [Prolixibacteraceae bacterium]
MKPTTKETGDTAEHVARGYLEEKGYKILNTNWRVGHLELDIVAQDGDELVIVEVKSRMGEPFEHPVDALSDKKIKKVITAAEAWIQFHNWPGETRFDLILVTINGSNEFEIEHYDDAFNSTAM